MKRLYTCFLMTGFALVLVFPHYGYAQKTQTRRISQNQVKTQKLIQTKNVRQNQMKTQIQIQTKNL